MTNDFKNGGVLETIGIFVLGIRRGIVLTTIIEDLSGSGNSNAISC